MRDVVKISSMASRRRRQSSDGRSLALNFVPPDRELGRKQPRAPPFLPATFGGRWQASLAPTRQMSPQYLIVAGIFLQPAPAGSCHTDQSHASMVKGMSLARAECSF